MYRYSLKKFAIGPRLPPAQREDSRWPPGWPTNGTPPHSLLGAYYPQRNRTGAQTWASFWPNKSTTAMVPSSSSDREADARRRQPPPPRRLIKRFCGNRRRLFSNYARCRYHRFDDDCSFSHHLLFYLKTRDICDDHRAAPHVRRQCNILRTRITKMTVPSS